MAPLLFEQRFTRISGFSSRPVRRIADIAELGPFVIVGESFVTKVPLFLSEPISQSSTDQSGSLLNE